MLHKLVVLGGLADYSTSNLHIFDTGFVRIRVLLVVALGTYHQHEWLGTSFRGELRLCRGHEKEPLDGDELGYRSLLMLELGKTRESHRWSLASLTRRPRTAPSRVSAQIASFNQRLTVLA